MKQIYIHLGESRDDMPIGSSYFWGYPDMLPETPVPMTPSVSGDYVKSNSSLAWGIDPVENPKEIPMGFLCQINLAELPEDCNLLPRSGLLLFYGNIAYYKALVGKDDVVNEISSPRQVRVIYIPGDKMDSLVRKEDAITWRTPKPMPFAFDNEPEQLSAPQMQMFGKPELFHGGVLPEAYKDWIVLWQTGSFKGGYFNCNFNGRLYYIISREALAALDFSDVRAIVLPDMIVKICVSAKEYGHEESESSNFEIYLHGLEMKDPVCVNDLIPVPYQEEFQPVYVQITPQSDKLQVTGGYEKVTLDYKNHRQFVTPTILLDDASASLSISIMHRHEEINNGK